MKKILVFLLFFYLASCKYCHDIDSPKSAEECFQAETRYKDCECCYTFSTGNFYGTKINRPLCLLINNNQSLKDFKRGMDGEEDDNKIHYVGQFYTKEIKCPGRSYPEEA